MDYPYAHELTSPQMESFHIVKQQISFPLSYMYVPNKTVKF